MMYSLRNFVSLTIVFLCQTVLAQKYSVGFSYAPTKSELNKARSNIGVYEDKYSHNGYCVSTNLKYILGRNIRISSGVEYEKLCTGFTTRIDTRAGVFYPESVLNLNYLSLPVFFEFTFGNKAKGIMQIGQSISFLSSESVDRIGILNASWVTYVPDVVKFNHAIIGGVGFEYSFSNKIAINLITNFSYGVYDINAVNNDNPVKTNSKRSFLGINYSFVSIKH